MSETFGVYLDGHDEEQAARELERALLGAIHEHIERALRRRRGQPYEVVMSDAIAHATANAIGCAFHIGVAWGRDRDEHERVEHPGRN